MKLPMNCQQAIATAEALIENLHIATLPVDPFAIAKKHEIVVQAKPSSSAGVSGFLMKVGDTFGIMYATHIQNEGFVRFTIAHELGHFFLPGHPEKLFPNGDGLHHSHSGFISRDPTEEEADHFAATLLMPPRPFSAALNDAGEGFSAIQHLASVCKASITATAIQFATRSPDPVAVIVSNGDRIEYCFLSEVLRDLRGITWIRKGDCLPRRTQTHAFNSNKDKVRSAGVAQGWTSLDLWLDGAPAIEMKEDVVGLGTYDRTLTVLFTDQAIEDEDDYDDPDD